MVDIPSQAAILNITIDRGTYWEIEAAHTNDDDTPIDFTGWSGKMVVSKNYKSAILKEYSTANGRMSLSNIGVMKIDNLDGSYDDDLNGKMVQNIWLTDPSGHPFLFYKGQFNSDGVVGD